MRYFFNQYVGIPYKALSYDRSRGLFCYSLVRLVLEEEFAISIPKHNEIVKEAMRNPNSTDISLLTVDWKKLHDWNSMKPGDVLRMRGVTPTLTQGDIITNQHVGICVSPRTILHTEKNTGSIAERVGSKRFEWRPLQAYRHISRC